MRDLNDLELGKEDSDDIWILKQYCVQNQLDAIHAHLVHSNWKRVLQSLSSEDEKELELKDEDDINLELDDNGMCNKGKYMTDLSDSDEITSQFGFGIEHLYPYLKPRFESIQDELTRNTMCCLSSSSFQASLVEAIQSHKIAMEEYQNELICKYYDSQYNIIRNELIG
eukprot:807525_1